MNDQIRNWAERIRTAAASGTAQCIRGGGSKDFYGRQPVGEILATTGYSGIVNYEPSELVVTVRAGKQRAVLIQGAKDIRASEKNIAHVGIAEPGQVTIEGIRPGEVSVQVARQGSEKNFKLVVQVIP